MQLSGGNKDDWARRQSASAKLCTNVIDSFRLAANLLSWNGEETPMSQIFSAILVVVALTLTAYLGIAAWQSSGGDRSDITGTTTFPHE